MLTKLHTCSNGYWISFSNVTALLQFIFNRFQCGGQWLIEVFRTQSNIYDGTFYENNEGVSASLQKGRPLEKFYAINPLHAFGLFLCALKTSGKQGLSDVFMQHRKKLLTGNKRLAYLDYTFSEAEVVKLLYTINSLLFHLKIHMKIFRRLKIHTKIFRRRKKFVLKIWILKCATMYYFQQEVFIFDALRRTIPAGIYLLKVNNRN